MFKFNRPANLSNKKAFSLMEIMVAISLLGLVIIIVCGVFVRGLDAIKKGKYRACAIHVCNQKFSELDNLDFGNPSGIEIESIKVPPPDGYIEGFADFDSHGNSIIPWDSTMGVVDFEILGLQEMAGIEYNFHIFIEGYDVNLKKFKIQINWQEPGGKRKLILSKLVTRRI